MSAHDPGPYPSWIQPLPARQWPEGHGLGQAIDPFVRYRKLLWSWQRAMDAGWSDDDFIALVGQLNAAIGEVDGSGFVATPFTASPALADRAGVGAIWVKDETGNVGGSHKARHLMGLLLHLGVDAVAQDARLAISSCGNAALGAATVARAARRPIDVFIPPWADKAVVAALDALDATIHVCERRDGEVGDPCMLRFQEAVAQGALPFGVQATENRWTLDGGKTLGFELADQLSQSSARLDALIIQVGGGALLTSCAAALIEAASLGVLDAAPPVWAAQTEGCAPFDRAWQSLATTGSIDQRLRDAQAREESLMQPWPDPHSAATGILDDVTYDWLGVVRALLSTGGGSVVASEADIVAARTAVRAAGFNVDHTGSAGYAGVLSGRRRGLVSLDSSVGVLATGVLR